MISHVSATSISLFREGCNRRWFERYVLGKRGDSSPAMVLGNKVHTELENYLRDGSSPSLSIEGKIAKSGLKHLPPPSDELLIEISLEDYPIETPVSFKGFIDCFIPPHLSESGVMEVLDHKTTSNFKYAKTEDELSVNLQLIIYARHILEYYPHEEDVKLTHVSYLTKTPYRSIKRSVTVSREHVYTQFESIIETVHLMIKASEQDIHLIEKNEKFCWSYGKRCPYYDDCMVTTNNKGVKNMSKKHLEIIDKLRGEKPVKKKETKTVNKPVLYIGCRPMKEKVTLASDLIKPMCEAICKSKNVDHISLVPYAQGWDLLNTALVHDGLGVQGAIYIDPRTQLYTRIGDTLASLVEEVVTIS